MELEVYKQNTLHSVLSKIGGFSTTINTFSFIIVGMILHRAFWNAEARYLLEQQGEMNMEAAEVHQIEARLRERFSY